MAYVYLIAALLLNTAANLCIKVGSTRMELTEGMAIAEKLKAVATNYILMSGLVLFAANVALYARALKELPISRAYPIMTSGGFLLITLYAWMFLGESLTGTQIAGLVLVTAGIILISVNMNG